MDLNKKTVLTYDEILYVNDELERCGGDRKKAAEKLNIPYAHLNNLISNNVQLERRWKLEDHAEVILSQPGKGVETVTPFSDQGFLAGEAVITEKDLELAIVESNKKRETRDKLKLLGLSDKQASEYSELDSFIANDFSTSVGITTGGLFKMFINVTSDLNFARAKLDEKVKEYEEYSGKVGEEDLNHKLLLGSELQFWSDKVDQLYASFQALSKTYNEANKIKAQVEAIKSGSNKKSDFKMNPVQIFQNFPGQRPETKVN